MLTLDTRTNTQDWIEKIITVTHPYPMTNRLAFKIYRTYGQASVKRLMENPYTLARDVTGIGEQTADQITKSIELRLGTTFTKPPVINPHVPKYHYGGPGNGKLSAQQILILKQKLHKRPNEVLPDENQLKNPNWWTVPDIKKGIKVWFNVSWSSDSTYRGLLKKSNLAYSRNKRAYVPILLTDTSVI